jgi:squalene cyclase
MASGNQGLLKVDFLLCASSIAFCSRRLRSSQCNDQLVNEALKTILRDQSVDGPWPLWAENKVPSIEATAMCLHALSLGKPRGWDRAAAKAVKWLWSVQEREGCWSEAGQPDAVYLTVLVLDAIDLASGPALFT